LPHLLSAFHAEAIAAEKGLGLAAHLGIQRIYLETDSMVLKASLERREIDMSSLGCVFERIKEMIRSNFVQCKVGNSIVCPSLPGSSLH
jgi:hypothetical protein